MEGRKHGFCKDFAGRSHYLPKNVCDILFTKVKNDPSIVSNYNNRTFDKSNKKTTSRKPTRSKT